MQKVAAGDGNTARDFGRQKVSKVYHAGPGSANSSLRPKPKYKSEVAANGDYVPALMAQAALYSQHPTQAGHENLQRILRRFPDLAPAQKHLAALYAQDEATIPQAYELAVKARKYYPTTPSWPPFWVG